MLTDGRRTDGRTTDAGVTGILIAHLGAFGSGELKKKDKSWFSRTRVIKFVQLSDSYVGRHSIFQPSKLITKSIASILKMNDRAGIMKYRLQNLIFAWCSQET